MRQSPKPLVIGWVQLHSPLHFLGCFFIETSPVVDHPQTDVPRRQIAGESNSLLAALPRLVHPLLLTISLILIQVSFAKPCVGQRVLRVQLERSEERRVGKDCRSGALGW